MKKIIRLTESDLTQIIKRVIKEQIETNDFGPDGGHRHRDGVELNANEIMIDVHGAGRVTANKHLKQFLRTSKPKFISFQNCEELDFSEVDLCQYPDLLFVNLSNTPNNLEETQNNCYEKVGDWGYIFNGG